MPGPSSLNVLLTPLGNSATQPCPIELGESTTGDAGINRNPSAVIDPLVASQVSDWDISQKAP
jgi:hypothetical protein